MISEIYAAGLNGVSAFVIVENGIIVHYGSHKWNGTISFEGITHEADDDSCEIMAVICAMMMCQNNGRKLVNIYTGRDDAERRYFRRQSDNPYMASLKRHSEGIDVYADKWKDEPLKNLFITKITELIKNKIEL